MAKISRKPENLFAMPKGSFIRNKRYVYINVSTKYVTASQRKNSGKGYVDHDALCVGVLQDPEHPETRMFYGNEAYHAILNKQHQLPPPEFSDSLSVGLHCWMGKEQETMGLAAPLVQHFGEETANQILDCCSYMLSRSSASLRHYPSWARDHALFSPGVADAAALGAFLRKSITPDKVTAFLAKWAPGRLGAGALFLCQDTTADNRPPEGVLLEQEEASSSVIRTQAASQDTLWVVVRQSDGLPLGYFHSSRPYLGNAPVLEAIPFLSQVGSLRAKQIKLCPIWNSGTLSWKDLRALDLRGSPYLFRLAPASELFGDLKKTALPQASSRSGEPQSASGEEWADTTVPCTIYEGGPTCYAHVRWREVSAKGAGTPAEMQVLISREEKTAQDCWKAYEKWRITQEYLHSVKSALSLDEAELGFGLGSAEMQRRKEFLWFVSALFCSRLYRTTCAVCKEDEPQYSVPEAIASLEAIKGDRSTVNSKYQRRYKLAPLQEEIMKFAEISEDSIDKRIDGLGSAADST